MSLSSRDRVIRALNFKPVDRVPKDLGGMLSSSVSAFVYDRLARELGLPGRIPKIYDSCQMLAMPDMDVLEALGCDVATIMCDMTNAFEQPGIWKEYDFNGRLPAFVREPGNFKTLPDGTIQQVNHSMPPSSYVFDIEHGGSPLDLSGELPKPSLAEVEKNLKNWLFTDARIKEITQMCRRVRESTDKAVFFNGYLYAGISIGAFGGLAVFPLLCVLEPEFVAELHGLILRYAVRNTQMLLPEIKDYVDVMMVNSDDWGTQNSLIASPDVYRNLFMPYYRIMNDEIHRIAPEVKTFLHSCGAIYNLIDLVIQSGFDVLNPVQWSAGAHDYKQWKDKCRNRISLWGGGVNSQATLPFCSIEQVAQECKNAVEYLKQDSGYVFCSIHNILAEIDPKKIITLYRTAAES
jgi:uroporphyrinogen decarboxylase